MDRRLSNRYVPGCPQLSTSHSIPPQQIVGVTGSYPYVGNPSLEVFVPIFAPRLSDKKSYGEGEARDCSQFSNGFGYSAQCWREDDSSDKRFHVYIKAAAQGCPGDAAPFMQATCPTDTTAQDICNAR